ncbi:S-adenosyl-L-methionine-dependent methyltransferase [Fomitiporia mediterranea MF3/22]|uniref:S-adenosyl-L-methionine-dependent methyltransferase n=1 Tax=Fomitiporia mediterranea (strain MF3/22) TaxID=694068 RepID=UPI000440850F|nr:S-adenosyl-L-methionine-dependent methyltransferase [Fomitiporia mediterranea MF3/22]EJD07854.1 S-adenosyl-L-methionine-dependent methyltransferase [Fomitiporia mediterranea MF3/22]
MDVDIPQARRLVDLISSSLAQFESQTKDVDNCTNCVDAIPTIVSAATQLAALVRPPEQVVIEVATGFTLSAALRFVTEANVPEVIRALTVENNVSKNSGETNEDWGVAVSDIAQLCGVHAGKLERMLRLLATHHIFAECPPIQSSHSHTNDNTQLNTSAPPEVRSEHGEGEARFANNRLSAALDSGAKLEDILDPTLLQNYQPYSNGARTNSEEREEKRRKIENTLIRDEHEEEEIRKKRWAAKYGGEAPGAALSALVGIMTDESMFHATALTDVLLHNRSKSRPSTSTNQESSSVIKSEDPEDSPLNTAFSLARNLPDKAMFDWLSLPSNAHRLHRFGCAMRSMGALGSGGETEVLNGYDFASLPHGSVIIDVGGGVGAASLPILRENLHLKLMVQDTEEVVKVAPSVWERQYPEALHANRVSFQVQDFFEPQPTNAPGVTNGSPAVFLLRMIIHDWPDPHCIRILKHLRAAAGRETRLVIVDSVLMGAYRRQVPTSASTSEAPFGKDGGEKMSTKEAPEPLLANWGVANGLAYRFDLIMLSNHNACERTLSHFNSLLSQSGWGIEAVHTSSSFTSNSKDGSGSVRPGVGESWMAQIVCVPAD